MKIYHTETQADYDALMVELKAKGIDTLPKERWKNHRGETVVFVRAIDKNHNSDRNDTTYSDVAWAIYKYPDEPITKYKAKVNEKMKFTKENVEAVIDEYFRQADFEPCSDLIAEIHNLDNTPKKVVVPKFVAEWIEWNKETGADLQTTLKCYRHYCDNINFRPEAYSKKAVQWYVDNPYKFIQAYEDGYTIEPEQLYYIPLPHLETSDGIQQVLSQRKGDKNYFASRPTETLKQRFTKEEIAQVPEIYKFYATLIEEEEECN